METLTEDALIERARAGDRTALEELVARYEGRLYRFGMKMCGHPEDARDVVQDTFLSVAKSIGSFRGKATFSSWLYKIAHSFCTKQRRRQKHASHTHPPLYPEAFLQNGTTRAELTPHDEVVRRELWAALERAIGELPPAFREVFVLRDLEGLSVEQTAEILGLRVATVKTRLHRARLAVREQLLPFFESDNSARPRRRGCPDAALLLSRYLEGELSPRDCAEMEGHLQSCHPCRQACASLRQVLSLCRSLPEPKVPPELAEAIRAGIRRLSLETASAPRSRRTN